MNNTTWLERFPALAVLDDPAWHTLLAQSRVVDMPAGSAVFRSGDRCRNYLLVLEGSVRVQKVADNGREITLYRVTGGQSCVLTTDCLMAGETYPAEGVTETPVVAVAIPQEAFQRALSDSPGFRSFVFAAYGQRVAGLILLVEEVAFGRVDARLAQRLLSRAGDDDALQATHQELAAELGTAREVVSRQLKEFEHHGWVRLFRGRIELGDRTSLRRLCSVSEM